MDSARKNSNIEASDILPDHISYAEMCGNLKASIEILLHNLETASAADILNATGHNAESIENVGMIIDALYG